MQVVHSSVLALYSWLSRVKAAAFLESPKGNSYTISQENGALDGTQKGVIPSARERPELCPGRGQGGGTKWRGEGGGPRYQS